MKIVDIHKRVNKQINITYTTLYGRVVEGWSEEKIIEYYSNFKRYKYWGFEWTDEIDKAIIKSYKQWQSLREMAKSIWVARTSIRSRLIKLGAYKSKWINYEQ